MPYNDFPLEECRQALERKIAEGWTFYQKWTCAHCGERVTANEPNTLTTHGHHEDCGHTTDITKTGCNYMLIAEI